MSPTYPQTMDIHAGRYSGTSSTANVDGTASQPSIAFGDDQDTGIYSPNDNKIAFTVAGAQAVCVDSDGIDLPSGKVIKINGSTVLTATSFTGTAATATNATNTTNVTVADESSDTTCFPLFATAATGNLPPKSGSNLTFNSSSGLLTATSFAGASTTQSAGDNSTKLATTAYVDTATAALVDSAPSNLNTLNELAAALNDDADLANTVNTSIATKLPLAGGQMTGNITFSGSQTVDGRDVSADGSKLDGIATSANNYTHPNHSGDVTSSSDGATTIANDAVTAAKIADLDGDVKWLDSQKAVFGTGSDLEIYHDGSHTWAKNSTGRLILQTDGDQLQLRGDIVKLFDGDAQETMLVASLNGDVELYYDDSKKFETASDGVAITGDVTVTNTASNPQLALIAAANGTAEIQFGDANDAVRGNIIYHNGTAGDKLQFNGYNNTERLNIDSSGNVNIPNDTGKLRLGTGADLQIYHNGTHSYIENDTGQLTIKVDEFRLLNNAGSENMIDASADGAVKLYYNSSSKLETQSNGVTVNGWVYIPDSDGSDNMVRLGNGADLKIYHDGSNSRIHNGTGELIFRTGSNYVFYNSDGTEKHAKFNENGSVELYYDNAEKLSTETWGVEVTGTLRADVLNLLDDEKIKIGDASDLQIFHSGVNSVIDNNTGGLYIRNNVAADVGGDIFIQAMSGENSAKFIHDGAVELYHNNSKKFETYSTGVEIVGNLWIEDGSITDNRVTLGTGGDLNIYHDGSNSYIRNFTGGLNLCTDDSSHLSILGGENMAETLASFHDNGACKFYHDNTLKLETASNGITVSSGHITLDSADYNIYLQDGGKVKFGNGEDLRIYHDNSAGNNKVDFDNDLKLRPKGSEDGIVVEVDGPVKAWYDDAKKFETKSNGIKVWGAVEEISDITLKRNIKVIDHPLTKLKEIKGYTYQFKENGQSSAGVIAQEVEKVFPQLVHGVEGAKGVDYSGLTGVLIESVKELNTEVVTNSSDISTINSQISDFASDVSGVIDEDQIRSKTKIQDGINKVKALNSYQVTLNKDSKIRDGFLSSDVKTIYGREETSLIPTLTAALSEAIVKIEALEAKVSALEAQ